MYEYHDTYRVHKLYIYIYIYKNMLIICVHMYHFLKSNYEPIGYFEDDRRYPKFAILILVFV